MPPDSTPIGPITRIDGKHQLAARPLRPARQAREAAAR